MSLRKFFLKRKITYRLYLYYNLYIRHKKFLVRKTYSQWGEDKEIIKFFKHKLGNYLDIGCYHPVMYSNTCLLHKNGWKGLNIDLNQTSIDLFNIARPKDINLCRAIGSSKKKVEVFFDSYFSPVNTIDAQFYRDQKKTFFKNQFKKIVISESLKKILSRYKRFKKFDFINIDAEGMDYKVLKQIDLAKLKTLLIAIETHHFNGDKTKDYSKILKHLNKYKFKLLKRFGPTSLFKKIN